METITLRLTLDLRLPVGVKSTMMEVSKMTKPEKRSADANAATAVHETLPELKLEECGIDVISTLTEDGYSLWPAEDYFEGDDVYDELHPRG